MAFIPEETRREIRERTNIVEVIGEAVSLRKAGASWKGLCPFHAEKTPSFTVSEARGFFHCFGCGTGGDAFDFLMRREGMTFPEAARALARRAGVPLPVDDLSPEARRAEEERAALLAVNAAAAAFFTARLGAPEGRAAREYLAARGIARETVAAFGLGYAPEGWDHLLRHLASQGHRADLVARAGLAVPRKEGSGHYDRFRDRLMIPIADLQGRVVAFGGRAMAADQEPKYLNSAESPLYRKGEVLYGLPQARETIRQADQAIVVEGYFDGIGLHQAGIRETVATCGTALTAQHVQALMRYTRQVITLFDGDEAGMRAAERSLPLFLEAGVAARIAELPRGEDPDTFVRRHGADALRERLRWAKPLLEAVIDFHVERVDVRTVEGKVQVLRSVQEHLARLRDRFARDTYAKILAERLGGAGEDEELVRRHMALRPDGAATAPARAPAKASTSLARPVAAAGREADGDCLIRAVLFAPEVAAALLEGRTLEELGDPAVAAVVGAVSGLLRQEGPAAVTADRVAAALPDGAAKSRLAGVAVGLDDLGLDEATARRQGEDAVRSIHARWVDAELKRVRTAIRDAERRGVNVDELTPLLEQSNALVSEQKRFPRYAS